MFTQKHDEVYFVPLGGCGYYGANLALYGAEGKWLIVDCGMGFANSSVPGIDIILPDPRFIESIIDDVVGMVITHGHEDHIGGIPHLWDRIRCPIYATKFTAEQIKRKIEGKKWQKKCELIIVDEDIPVDLEPFKIKYIKMAHSIPEGNALAIDIEGYDTILHTGDWKLDKKPMTGNVTDEKSLRELGDKGVLAILGDSTNAMVPGHSTSEDDVRIGLTDTIAKCTGKVIVSCFSSNVARLITIIKSARANGRDVALVGRSLWRMEEIARATGYIKEEEYFLEADDMMHLPDDKMLFICTGSQGESRAALRRVAEGKHRSLEMEKGDTVILSARAIPGNEKEIDIVMNRFMAKGVEVISSVADKSIHASGHPYIEELKQIFAWTKPKIAIPVHGEEMQLRKHGELATKCGVKYVITSENGKVIKLAPGIPKVVAEVEHGILAIDGNRIIPIGHEAILTRKRIMYHGSAVVTLVIDSMGDLVSDPVISAMGLVDEALEDNLISGVIAEIKKEINNMPRHIREDDADFSEKLRQITRRFLSKQFDKKPQTRIHLVRI